MQTRVVVIGGKTRVSVSRNFPYSLPPASTTHSGLENTPASPLLLHRFGDSGVLVVERRDASVENTLERTVQRVCDGVAGLSAEEMAHADGMAVVLARER